MFLQLDSMGDKSLNLGYNDELNLMGAKKAYVIRNTNILIKEEKKVGLNQINHRHLQSCWWYYKRNHIGGPISRISLKVSVEVQEG